MRRQKRGELAVFELARNHGVRLADGAAFVACVFQTLVGTFAQSAFSVGVVALSVCLSASIGLHGIVQSPIDH